MIVDGNTYCRVITPILPTEYQEVEYVESTGTQYIDTGLLYNSNLTIEIKSKRQNVANNGCFGVNPLLSFTNATSKKRIRYNGTTYDYLLQTDLSIDKIEQNKFYVDNVLVHTFENAEGITSNYTMYMFARRTNTGSIDEDGRVKIYYVKITENGISIRNFIPCYRKSDNEIGMYDTVNKVFYTNQGTGTFLKGNNVVHTIKYKIPTEERPYISGHVTDGSNTFTFKVNNANVTVPVDENGNWKWFVDRTITRLYESFYLKNALDFVKFYNIDLSNINTNGAYNSAFRQISTLVVDMRHCKGEINTMLDYTFLGTKVTWYMPNLGTNTKYKTTFSNNSSTIIPFGYIKCSCDYSALQTLTEQSVVNIINAAAANVTYTLHSTVYNKCASGGEWYTDIQSAIDAKAQQGYTVTLISA